MALRKPKRIQLTVDEDIFEQLKELKGDRSWEDFLVEAGLNYVKAEESAKVG